MDNLEPICTHISGYKMPQEIAYAIDRASRGLPRDFGGYRRRAATAKSFAVNAELRQDESFITTNAVDFSGDIVLPEGMDTTGYNRAVMWCHDYSQPPVGRCISLSQRRQGKKAGVVGVTEYFTPPPGWKGDWLPNAILHLMQHGGCIAKSIGFLTVNARPPSAAELSANPDWAGGKVIDRWIMFEYSCCSIGMNAEAVILQDTEIGKTAKRLLVKSLRDLRNSRTAPRLDQRAIFEAATRRALETVFNGL